MVGFDSSLSTLNPFQHIAIDTAYAMSSLCDAIFSVVYYHLANNTHSAKSDITEAVQTMVRNTIDVPLFQSHSQVLFSASTIAANDKSHHDNLR